MASAPSSSPANLKDALLAEIRKSKAVLYNMVVAQAQKIDVGGDRVTFTFSSTQRALRETLEQNRAWLESVAQQIAGRRIAIAGVQADAASPSAGEGSGSGDQPSLDLNASDKKSAADRKTTLREQALADAGVQTMLEVFPAEIRDVEEM